MDDKSKSIIGVEGHQEDDGLKICKYIRNDFTEAEWDEFLSYDDFHYLTTYKEACPSPKAVKRRCFTDVDPQALNHRWLLLLDQKIIGRASISYYTPDCASYEDNKNTAEVFIDVHHDYRQKGYGQRLHDVVLGQVIGDHKTKIQSDYTLACSGEFCKKNTYKIESSRNISRLDKADINKAEVEAWAQASQRKIIIFKTVPDQYLEEYCRLYTECGGMAPDYQGDYSPCEQTTPDQRRKNEKLWQEMGIVQYTAVALEADGRLSGMSELDYFEDNPSQVDQGLTGVLKAYRGHKIGLHLKAALLVHLWQVNPLFETIHTGNSLNNGPMLAINRRFGFKRFYDHYLVSKVIGSEEVRHDRSYRCNG